MDTHMMPSPATALDLSRRAILAGMGGLAIAVSLPARAQQGASPVPATNAAAAGANAQGGMLTAYVVVKPDSKIVMISPTTEMGQGSQTAHAAIIADELGVDIASVTVETAIPADAYRWGGSMGSGGSWGVRRWSAHLHRAAAQAREMLVQAAAARWKVDPASVTLADGRLSSGKNSLPIGEVAADAAKLTPPENPTLRDRTTFRYVGHKVPRLDIPAKVRGQQVYSLDFRLPGMLYACARLNPVFHGDIARFDEAPALAVKGVKKVVKVKDGVAVLADTVWAAIKGADALTVTLAPSPQDKISSTALAAMMREGLGAAQAAPSKNNGDVDAAFKAAAKTVTADYAVPYISHAPMETWSSTALFKDGKLEIWAPTQVQDRSLRTAAATAGIANEAVTLHTLSLGGGFGRRLVDDGVPGSVQCAMAMPGTPVKFFWRREDEMERGYYRPAQMARLTGALDAKGNLTGLAIRTTGPSMRREFLPGSLKDGELDGSSVQDLTDLRYGLPNYRLDYAMRHVAVTAAPWRAVGATQNAFFLECFIDELAAAAGKDPVAFRRELLKDDARALKVVETAAAKGNWGAKLPPGHAQGFAYFASFNALSAHVVEASIVDGVPKVHKVTAVLDCGSVVLPDGARSQMEGGVIMSLSTALFEAVTVLDGKAEQRNFDSYRLMRISEAPAVDVHFIESGESLGGVGEPGLPPTTPALVNALSTALGRRIRSLPVVEALQA
ncbi:xanthine dehydrogenase family protein molybdopterin-binding subunit [Niveispirillum irakense]|uniref:xanthine dehydrogenase family protein molybdopterin-binding subunit n=1 Tax=Niveispirillum irakense TaxID=34011 RepID=UPI00041DADDC|nr:molybdopterin cofactor-binding domain-containing protein [Niveispirillum irakense]